MSVKCANFAKSKAKQASIPKEVDNPSKIVGECLSLDISLVKAHSQGGAKFWLLVMDKATKMKWSFFLQHKSDTVETAVPFLQNLQDQEQKLVKYLCCNNAGENML